MVLALIGGCDNPRLNPADSGGQPQDAATQVDSAPPPDANVPYKPMCATPKDQPTLLSNAEYNLTVRDLLGDHTAPANGFIWGDNHDELGRLVFGDQLTIQGRMDQYGKAADTLAHAALARLDTLLPCDPVAMGEDACAMRFITAFGKRAYRRPLTADNQARLKDAYGLGRRNGTFETGIEAVIAAALKSPHFLEVEIDATPGRTPLLDGYEMASRLSYFIYHSMPDAELFAAADAGQLTTVAGVVAQAQRMLQDKKAVDGLNAEVSRWLSLDRLEQQASQAATAAADAALYRDMGRETLRFVQSNFFNKSPVRDLLRSTKTWVNGPLAAIYDLGGITGPDFQPATWDPGMRSGLLTQASLLTLTSNPPVTFPTLRGTFVINRLLCMVIPPPPNSGLLINIDPVPGESKRQTYARTFTAQPGCQPCHRLTDPIGFALESFDSAGRFRATDNGAAIDPSGVLIFDGLMGAFNGPADLADKIAGSSLFTDCVAQQWIAAALHRTWSPETDENRCISEDIIRNWQGYPLMDLIETIVRDPSFRTARGCSYACPRSNAI